MKTLVTMIFVTMAAIPTFAAIAGGDVQTQEYTYDFAKSGGAVGFIDLTGKAALPAGAVVQELYYMVTSAPTSTSGALISIGDAAGNGRYLAATAYNNAAYTLNVPVKVSSGAPLYLSSANMGKIGIGVTSGALTGGKIKVWMSVYKPKN